MEISHIPESLPPFKRDTHKFRVGTWTWPLVPTPQKPNTLNKQPRAIPGLSQSLISGELAHYRWRPQNWESNRKGQPPGFTWGNWEKRSSNGKCFNVLKHKLHSATQGCSFNNHWQKPRGHFQREFRWTEGLLQQLGTHTQAPLIHWPSGSLLHYSVRLTVKPWAKSLGFSLTSSSTWSLIFIFSFLGRMPNCLKSTWKPIVVKH